MVVVLVVGPEHEREHIVDRRSHIGAHGPHGLERGVGEHAAEIEEHGIDARSIGLESRTHDGTSPVCNKASKPASSRIGTPSCSALRVWRHPALHRPRGGGLLHTLPGDLPPWALMTSSARSRLKFSSVPVTTTDLPANV
jgi:hypothetical protein